MSFEYQLQQLAINPSEFQYSNIRSSQFKPSIMATGPKVVDACTSLMIDHSASSGAAGRSWQNISIILSVASMNISISENVVQYAISSAISSSFLFIKLPTGSLTASVGNIFVFHLCLQLDAAVWSIDLLSDSKQ